MVAIAEDGHTKNDIRRVDGSQICTSGVLVDCHGNVGSSKCRYEKDCGLTSTATI